MRPIYFFHQSVLTQTCLIAKVRSPGQGGVGGIRQLRSPISPVPRIWNRRDPGRNRRDNEGTSEGPHPPWPQSTLFCPMISYSNALLPLYSFLQNVPNEQDATICNITITPTQFCLQRKTAQHLIHALQSQAGPLGLGNMHPSDSSSDVGLQDHAPGG